MNEQDILNLIKDKLSVGVYIEGTRVTVRLFLDNEIISEDADNMVTAQKWD